ncbi:MAG TPA: 50S ribosomal protein L15 [Kiloniellaceae bacterium]|nr:50S ribosomal protein L15 [Kiloniellaceae bacterium]
MQLNQITDNRGARKNRKRVGRGIGSGSGKTAGAGMKGQKSRSGVAIKGFEGGQMPLHRRLPKRGFNNLFRKHYQIVNVGRLQKAVDAKKLDAGKPVDAEALVAAGLIKSTKTAVRLLAKGSLSANLKVTVAGASKAAIAAVEGAGGTVTVTEVAAEEPAAEASS